MNVTKKNLLEILGAICAAALFGASAVHVAAVACGVLLPAAKIYLIALCAAVFAGGCVYGNDPVTRAARKAARQDGVKAAHAGRGWGIFAAVVGGAGVLCLSAGSVHALFQAARSTQLALSDYGAFLACVCAAGLSMAAFGVCRIRGGVYAMALVLFLLLALGRSISAELDFRLAIPAACALVTMYAVCASDKSAALRTLISSALIAALLATALIPPEGTVYQPFNDAAQKVRVVFEDYFKFTHSRISYSLYMDGYQPLGEVLGGPAQPSEAEVMRVETEQALYLRGTVKNTYTGYSWTDSGVKSRYLYIDPMRAGVRSEVFGTDSLPAGAFVPAEAEVEFLADGTSALFVPYRTEKLSAPVSMAIYFNSVGEVFLPRNTCIGDSYSFTAWVPDSEDAVKQLSGAGGSGVEDASLIALPAGMDARIYALADSVTAGASTDYEKAAAIRDYLKANYEYTLDGAYGSRERDFVTDFLFEWKEGYCTYFASAMAVLSRAAGLPSRYVEGYRVMPEADGETIVTGEHAHAWTEIWIDGLGWMVFDATPGSGGEDADDTQGNGETDPNEPTPTPPADLPTPTPSPETGADLPTPTPETEPDAQNPPTPTPEAENEPPTPPENDNNDPPDRDGDSDLAWLWIVLLVLALLAACVLLVRRRLDKSDPVKVCENCEDTQTQLLIWYRALLTVFASEGQSPDSGETPAAFAQRMRAAGLATENFERFADSVMLSRYAGKQISESQLAMAQTAYEELVSQLRHGEKVRWLRRRILAGLGDIRRIP